MTSDTHNLDLVNSNAHTKFRQIILTKSQDIELTHRLAVGLTNLLSNNCIGQRFALESVIVKTNCLARIDALHFSFTCHKTPKKNCPAIELQLFRKPHSRPCSVPCCKITFKEWLDALWASAQKKSVFGVCEQQRHRPACASEQSDQCLCCSHVRNLLMLTFQFSS